MLCVGSNQQEVSCKVLLLDDTELVIDVKPSSRGHALLDEVLEHFNLSEKDFFGIRYLDDIQQTQWLDVNKTLKSQVKGSSGPPFTVYFGVRFYPADPCKLREEITRYQFFLQVKKDILQGRLPVTFDKGAELAALAIQSELGDYDPRRHTYGYVSEFRFVPNQTTELEERIAKLHRQLSGIVPSVAEYNYLDKVKWLDMYGVDLHPVQGEAGVEYFLGLTPTGIVVYKNKNKVGNYFWPRIVRVNFKGKTFTIRVKDKNGDENTYAFELTTKPACKHLWKCTVEHHAFFRLNHVSDISSSTSRLFSLGSKYRYSGRTEREIQNESAERKEPRVQRTPSKRHQRRSFESLPDGTITTESRTSSAYFDRKDIAIMKVITPDPVDRKYQTNSPKSTRSAPWEIDNNQNIGLFTGGSVSPVSFRSEKMKFPDQPRRMPSSGSESEMKRRYRSRKGEDSDKESDKMKRTRRRKDPQNRSDSNVSEGSSRHHRHRKRSSRHQDQENGGEGRENGHAGGHGSVPRDQKKNGSSKSLAYSDGGSSKGHRRRRRSKSPRHKPSEELKQYFQYGLVDPTPLSDEQKRDIPYMVVETNDAFKMKSPFSKHRRKSPHRTSQHEEDLKWIPPKDLNEEEVDARQPIQPDVLETAGGTRKDEVPESDESFVTAVGSHPNRIETHTAPIVKTKMSAGSGREDFSGSETGRSSHKSHHSSYSQNHYNKTFHGPGNHSGHPSSRLQQFSNLCQREIHIDGPHVNVDSGRLIQIDGPKIQHEIYSPRNNVAYSPRTNVYSPRADVYSPRTDVLPREKPPPYTPYQYHNNSHSSRRPEFHQSPSQHQQQQIQSPHSAAQNRTPSSNHHRHHNNSRYGQSPATRYHPPGMQPMYPAVPAQYPPYPPHPHPQHPSQNPRYPYRGEAPQYHQAYPNRGRPFYDGPEAEPSWPDATSSPVTGQVKPGYYKDAEVHMRQHADPRHSRPAPPRSSTGSVGSSSRVSANYREDRSTEL